MAPVHDYLLSHLPLLRNRDVLLELLTVVDRIDTLTPVKTDPKAYTLITPSPIYQGKLVQVNDELYAISEYKKEDKEIYTVYLDPTGIIPVSGQPLTYPTDEVELTPDTYPNIKDPITTTVGRVVTNYLLFQDPFPDKFPYVNELWSPKMLESVVMNAAISGTVSVDQLDRYVQNLYFYGHSTELSVPIFTRKSLTTDPRIKELKKELLKKYGEAIKAGDAVAMSIVEQELIKVDKEWLKDDPSMGFYGRDEGKSFGVHRKKMFLTHGMVGVFGAEGEFNFIDNSLSEGWTVKNFPAICNEIRSGSFSRGTETAKGGEESKFLMRIFQNTRITQPDCGTTMTIPVYLDKDTIDLYNYRYIVEKDGSLVVLDENTKSTYLNKTVELRSPMGCKTRPGYCYKCMGKLMETLNQESLTMMAIEIGGYFLKQSLAKFHGTRVSTMEIDDLNPFLF